VEECAFRELSVVSALKLEENVQWHRLQVSNNFNNEITTGHPAEDSWVEGLTYIKKIKIECISH